MKLILKTAAFSAAFALAACGGNTTAETNNTADNGAMAEVNQLDAAAGTIENAADNASGNAAEALGNQAEAVSNAADMQKDALDNTSANKQ